MRSVSLESVESLYRRRMFSFLDDSCLLCMFVYCSASKMFAIHIPQEAKRPSYVVLRKGRIRRRNVHRISNQLSPFYRIKSKQDILFIPTDRKGEHTLSILKASKSNYLLFVPILGRFSWLNTFELACATKAESRVLLVIKKRKKRKLHLVGALLLGPQNMTSDLFC